MKILSNVCESSFILIFYTIVIHAFLLKFTSDLQKVAQNLAFLLDFQEFENLSASSPGV